MIFGPVVTGLEKERGPLAIQIKDELTAAAFSDVPVHNPRQQTFACEGTVRQAQHLAASS